MTSLREAAITLFQILDRLGIVNLVLVQGGRLDRDYLVPQAKRLGIGDLLVRLLP